MNIKQYDGCYKYINISCGIIKVMELIMNIKDIINTEQCPCQLCIVKSMCEEICEERKTLYNNICIDRITFYNNTNIRLIN